MKQRINTMKEEWKKLLTFSALGWVKSTQILGKMGTTSPLKHHGREEELGQNGWVGLGKKTRRYIQGNLVPANGSSRHKVAPFSAG